MNPVLAHVLDNKLLYSSKSRSFSLDSTCAYCYWPGTGGRYFPIAKLRDKTPIWSGTRTTRQTSCVLLPIIIPEVTIASLGGWGGRISYSLYNTV